MVRIINIINTLVSVYLVFMILPLFASIIIIIFFYWIEKQNCCGLALEHLESSSIKIVMNGPNVQELCE